MSLLLSFGSVVIPLNAFAQPNSNANFVPGQYIVVLKDDADPTTFANSKGVVPEFVYEHALKGFSTTLSSSQVNQLSQDPRVKSIEQDQIAHIFSQSAPTGIDRIDAESTSLGSGQGVTVAIIDTGIDLDHPDLQNNINPDKSVTCIEKSPVKPVQCVKGGDDDNGHGSHVAGTVAAIDNSIGVVGVSPQAELWAIKVLDSQGSGRISWIVAGIDYVTENKADVANMSLGCECQSDALDAAISSSVAEGVTYAVAAGNSGKDAISFSPANHPDVITVSAIADSDGKCGSQGSGTSYGEDDTFASFSNFGSLVEIAAPGVNIYSTYLDGSYATASGTSMASPHVAGAAALLIASDSELVPNQVRDTLVSNGVSQTQSCDDKSSGFGGFSGDPDAYAEPLAYVDSVTTSPVVTITNPSDGDVVSGTVTISADASDSDGYVAQVEFFIDNSSIGVDSDGSDDWSASWNTTAFSDGNYSVVAEATDDQGNTDSHAIAVTIDNIDDPPTVSITNPNEGETVSNTVTITADAIDDIGVTQVEFFVDDARIAIDSDDSDGWSASWDTANYSDSSHTLTATATDTSNQQSTNSIIINVDNSVSSVIVDSITYTTEGGRFDDKHLNDHVKLVDDTENPVSGASVSIDLSRDGSVIASGTGTTGSDGIVTFSLKNAADGCYSTTVTAVTADGFVWDGATPDNIFCKTS